MNIGSRHTAKLLTIEENFHKVFSISRPPNGVSTAVGSIRQCSRINSSPKYSVGPAMGVI